MFGGSFLDDVPASATAAAPKSTTASSSVKLSDSGVGGLFGESLLAPATATAAKLASGSAAKATSVLFDDDDGLFGSATSAAKAPAQQAKPTTILGSESKPKKTGMKNTQTFHSGMI
jgi:hypothetical protein